MWRFFILVSTIPWARSQIDRQRDSKAAWDIKLNVPGDPGSDYPTLSTIPRTSFTCAGREPGYYADQQTNCQVFRVCTAGSTFGFQSFLCPNGTLFNQAFFVCDWWMNVNCGKSQELVNNNIERFGNLKPGPQLMKDVRKMITHPMRNPYNTGFLPNNFFSTQEYKPQSELLYPNGALISSQQLNRNNAYVPTRETFRNFEQVTNDINAAASTVSSQFVTYRNNLDSQRLQLKQNPRTQNLPANGLYPSSQKEYQTRNKVTSQPNYSNPGLRIALNNQKQSFNTFISNKGPLNNKYRNLSQEQKVLKTSNSKLPFTQNLLQAQSYHNNNGNQINTEAKQNLVSTTISPTIISKTIAFKSVVPGEKPGKPKSRITFKTWILKPKNAKLIVEHKSEAKKNLLPSASEQLISTSEPYVYDKPKQNLDLKTENSGYFYNQPIKQDISSPNSLLYASPTTFRPNIPSRVYLNPTSEVLTTVPPKYEISNLNYNTYIPPLDEPQLSRQYLSPLVKSEQIKLKTNEKLQTQSSSQAPQYEFINPNYIPGLTITKQSQVKTNNNNLTFTDVLTKEKLDISVNEIIKDTNKIIQSPQNNRKAEYRIENNFVDDNFLKQDDRSKEEVTSIPLNLSKSSKLVLAPSFDLQPPLESSSSYYSNNRISNLPYLKEPVNTIERTVSIKITIPEKIAKILFKNETNTEDIEILNTDTSNYLVYANNLRTKSGSGLTPIGKLSLVKQSNISNSQDLVFSFLADSLNAAKEYNNIAKQNILSTQPLQNYKQRDTEDITESISQLTSSQFTNNNNINRHNNIQQFAARIQSDYENRQNNYQQQATPLEPITSNRYTSERLSTPNGIQHNLNEIYSGQLYKLPVPDVTRDYYNSPNTKSPANQNIFQNPAAQYAQSPILTNNYFQKRPDIEIIRSQQLPYGRIEDLSTKQEISEQKDTTQLNNLIQSGNGITAQVQDSIVGTLPHPSNKDKSVTYKKNQTYYIFSQVHDHESNRLNKNENVQKENSNTDSIQVVPSVGYSLDDQNEQDKFLNSFQITSGKGSDSDISTDIDYSVSHPTNYGERLNYRTNTGQKTNQQSQAYTNNQNSRIEDLDNNEPNGYPKISPRPTFDS